MQYDLVIRGGMIYDGTGSPGFRGSIAVSKGKIVAVGEVSERGLETIDADGLAVAPGFIDVHTHYDAQILWDPLLTSSCWHGVTTVMLGNCGLALAPCRPEHRDFLLGIFARVEGLDIEMLEKGLSWTWQTFPEYMEAVERKHPALNVRFLMGHSAVRTFVMGTDAVKREATRIEIEQMKEAIRVGMQAGAAGFSISRSPAQTGIHGEPMPGKVASDEELIELCQTVAEFKRGFLQMVPRILNVYKEEKEREEDWELLRTIARRTELPTTWAGVLHQWDQPNLWREMLDKTDQAFKEGLRIYPQATCLQIKFNFTLENFTIFDDMPHWKKVNYVSPAERKRLFRDPDVRQELRYDVMDDPLPRVFSKRWDLVYVQHAKLGRNKQLEGKSIAEIAKAMGKDVFDTFLDLALEEDLQTGFYTIILNGDEDAVGEIINHPAALVSLSDGGAHVQFISDVCYPTDLLGRWVREKKAMSLERAIQVLTSMPAQVMGIQDRGTIQAGKMADLVVFDPTTVRPLEPVTVHDMPGGHSRLFQKAEGILHTVVNGIPVTRNDEHTGSYPGHLLK